MKTVGIVGLGSMSRPIARNLLAAGYDVLVWNRSAAPVEELVEAGARAAGTVAEVFSAGIVLSMLADDVAVRQTLLDPGMLRGVGAGALHVNLSTVSTALAREAAELHSEYQLGYVAAPVFGRVSVAEAGQLNILAGGEPHLIDRAQPLFDIIGSKTWRIGVNPEQANMVKIIGNYLIACAIQCTGEAISLAEAEGIDASNLVELLSSTLFPGRIYSSYGGMIANRAFQPAGFTTVLGRKDLHLTLDAARDSGIPLPVGDVLAAVFEKALAAGHAKDDWASISEVQPRRSSPSAK